MKNLFNFPENNFNQIVTDRLAFIPPEGMLACVEREGKLVNVVTSDKYKLAVKENVVQVVEEGDEETPPKFEAPQNNLYEVIVVVATKEGMAFETSLESLLPPLTAREEAMLVENQVLRDALEADLEEPSPEADNDKD